MAENAQGRARKAPPWRLGGAHTKGSGGGGVVGATMWLLKFRGRGGSEVETGEGMGCTTKWAAKKAVAGKARLDSTILLI